MDLSIIIVNWNSIGYLRNCLESLCAETTGIKHEIIVVDNASYDGCGEMLRTGFPQARFIQNHQNRGFAAANNLAVTWSSGRFLLFLNPDTKISGPVIARMLSVFDSRPLAGVVGCKLLNADLTVQTTCVQSFPTLWNEVLDTEYFRSTFPNSRLWGNACLYIQDPGVFEVEAISGACLMIRRDVFERVGGFSTRYFMYVEDRDLCYAVRRAGFPAYFINTAEVVHYGGTSSDSRSESSFGTVMRCESLLNFMRYRRGRAHAAAYRLAMALSACCRLSLLWLVAGTCGTAGASAVPRGAIRKWWAVFRWSLGLESWARSYALPGKFEAPAPSRSLAPTMPSLADTGEKNRV
jgi:GT2 family glycosyltransferase